LAFTAIAISNNDKIKEAINLFKKFKNEPMTGNVVILELEQLLLDDPGYDE
jgi:hypothetical protein